MKVAKCIEIISRYFSNQIPASEITGRVSNGLRYKIVLTRFTDISADENGCISAVINKKDASCDKHFSETNDRDFAEVLNDTIQEYNEKLKNV